MSTVTDTDLMSDIITNKEAQPQVFNTPNQDGGRVRFIRATYTKAATDELGVGAKIHLCDIPKGARVIDMYAEAPTAGATGEAKIGWDAGYSSLETADDDGFYTSDEFDPGDAAITNKKIAYDRPGLYKQFDDRVKVECVVTEITASSAADTWEFMIWYVLD